MSKISSIAVLFFLLTFSIQAQEKVIIENNPDYKFQSDKNKTTQTTTIRPKTYAFQQHWSFGGNIGMSFWNGGSDIMIAPKGYYHFSPNFITGVGVTYIYSDGDYRGFDIGGPSRYYNYHSNSFGGSIAGIYRPMPHLQLSVEYEGLQTEWRGRFDDSYWNNAIYLGASFVAGNVSFGFKYDVLYDSNKSVYGSAWNPVIGFYF